MTQKHFNTTHGMEGTTEYRIWIDMRRRCHSPQRPDYHRYGGRGIVVCEEWRNARGGFEKFFEDMGQRPSMKHTLERKRNDGPYCKDNCVWATKKQQANNTRTNRYIEVDGISLTVTQAAEKFGLHWNVVFQRLLRGWSIDRALKTPLIKAGDKRGKRGPYKPKTLSKSLGQKRKQSEETPSQSASGSGRS